MKRDNMEYFSDIEKGLPLRNINDIDHNVWAGIASYIDMLAKKGYFGRDFPEQCLDNQGCIGTDNDAFKKALQAEIPDLDWPLVTEKSDDNSPTCFLNQPKTPYIPNFLDIMDLIQFCFKHIAKPINGKFHEFYGHYHINNFDEQSGRDEFVDKINTIFYRNGLAYELKSSGEIKKILSLALEQMASTFKVPKEIELNNLFISANEKIYSPNVMIRYEALKDLWDFWERMKSAHNPAQNKKKESVTTLLDNSSKEIEFRSLLESEAIYLTEIGNKYFIRHSEMSQIKIQDSDHIEYLYQRMFSMLHLLSKNFPF